MRFLLFGLFPLFPFFWGAAPVPEKSKAPQPPAAASPAVESPPAKGQ